MLNENNFHLIIRSNKTIDQIAVAYKLAGWNIHIPDDYKGELRVDHAAADLSVIQISEREITICGCIENPMHNFKILFVPLFEAGLRKEELSIDEQELQKLLNLL